LYQKGFSNRDDDMFSGNNSEDFPEMVSVNAVSDGQWE
jgi:hypothetical protein